MNENKTNFDAMLNVLMGDLQVPIITVQSLEEEYWGQPAATNHIIIADGKDKVTDFTFVVTGKTDFLGHVHSLDMSFQDAIVEFSRRTLRCHYAVFKLYAL